MSGSNVPSFVWLVLGIAIFGVSSAGAIFTHVDVIPPLLRASWRLQLTALLLAPLAFWQWYFTEKNIKLKVFEPKNLSILVGSGFFLALLFQFQVGS